MLTNNSCQRTVIINQPTLSLGEVGYGTGGTEFLLVGIGEFLLIDNSGGRLKI